MSDHFKPKPMSNSGDDAVGKALEALYRAIASEGGVGYYVMVIRGHGKTETFKGAHKQIDGFHFYAHLLASLSDDVKEDLAPYLSVKLFDGEKAL